jgi:hypothetical protein
MSQEQELKYLVWEDWWSRPLFGIIKSMTHRQWLVFVFCTFMIVIAIAVVLGSLLGLGAGISILFVPFVTLPLMWLWGRKGALRGREKRP